MHTLKKNIKVFGRGFIEGFSSLLDLYPERRTINTHGLSDDYKAIKNDWENVGNDFRKAISGFDKKYKAKDHLQV